MQVTDRTTMRDAFFDRLYELASKDRNIVLVSADMGAPSLDKFRKDLAGQYVDTGIAEQNAMLVASGLGLSGKKTYVYAIAPFVTTRVHEFAKLELSLMKCPVTIIGIGAGYSYDDSGPTHHNVEDIAIMRALPNLEILSPSDSIMSAAFADLTARSKSPGYIRLDRKVQRIKYFPSPETDFTQGFAELKQGDRIGIVATGNMVDQALEVSASLPDENIGVIDVYRLKPLNPGLVSALSRYKGLVSLEEHFLIGGLGSLVSELITDNDLPTRLRRVGVDDQYHYEYGGRQHIQEKMGIGKDAVLEAVEKLR